MRCKGCGNQSAYHIRTYFEAGELLEVCNECGNLCMEDAGIPDVYWPGHEHYNPNLVDKTTGQPVLLRTPRHKAQVMKELGVTEAGDRIHGSTVVERGNWRTR